MVQFLPRDIFYFLFEENFTKIVVLHFFNGIIEVAFFYVKGKIENDDLLLDLLFVRRRIPSCYKSFFLSKERPIEMNLVSFTVSCIYEIGNARSP